MIIGLTLIVGGLAWLAWETKFLTLRLPRYMQPVLVTLAQIENMPVIVFAAMIVFEFLKAFNEANKVSLKKK